MKIYLAKVVVGLIWVAFYGFITWCVYKQCGYEVTTLFLLVLLLADNQYKS